MSAESWNTFYYWAEVGSLGLVVLAALLVVARGRWAAPSRTAVRAVLLALTAAAIVGVVRPPVPWLAAGIALLVGLVLGWLAGRSAAAGTRLGAWLTGLAMIVLAFTALFGSVLVFAWSLVLLAAALGAVTGQAAGQAMRPADRSSGRGPEVTTPLEPQQS